MINHKHKFIFIHIHKSGGSSMCHDLGIQTNRTSVNFMAEKNRIDHHETISESLIFNQKYKEYFKFAFVRNSWDRLLSLWLYFQKRGAHPVNSVDFTYFITHLESCICELDNSLFSNSQRKINLLYPQCHFIFDWWGNNAVDFIGRFENLQSDYDIVCDKIGIPRRKLSHKNKTQHTHYSEYYNKETRDIVAEKYKQDIDYFGYEFGR